MNYKEFFRGKKVTQVGLGLLGRGVGDAAFLAECGADLVVTDMKSVEELAPSLEKLKQFPSIKFKLGGHDLDDFKHCDLVIRAGAAVPINSPFIAEARKNSIPVETDSALFCKLVPEGVVTVGITGTRGKSTTTHLIHHILKTAGKNVHLGGNIRDIATLPLLKSVNSGDYVVLELDSWQLQGFGDAHISPHIAVFTTFMDDHMNYYKGDREQYFNDKANIFRYQGKDDVLILGEDMAAQVEGRKLNVEGRVHIAKREEVSRDWQVKIPGEHNLLNIACAVEACTALGISDAGIRAGVESFEAVEGRLQLVREVKGVKIYNDNNATTPEATIAAIRALKQGSEEAKKLILICGGADKGLELGELEVEIKRCSKSIVFLPGTGSERLQVEATKVASLEEAISKALEVATPGDTILFSPAFASFGPPPGGFKNEYERNDEFMKIISNL